MAQWLAQMDVGGPTVVRSPWAFTVWARDQAAGFRPTPSLDQPCTFHRERGTLQGDVSSPHNWVSFFDIVLRVLRVDRFDWTSPAYGEEFTAPG